jgi:hypothetical protein
MALSRSKLSFLLLAAVASAMALAALLLLTGWAAAQETGPAGPTMALEIVPETGNSNLVTVGNVPAIVPVGRPVQVAVIAANISAPGIFGGQFQLTYDPRFLQAVEGSLQPGPELEPVVPARATVNTEAGLVEFAASRQGDVNSLSGRVVLATVWFNVLAPTGQPITLSLSGVRLGARGGFDVPLTEFADLAVLIVDNAAPPTAGDIEGTVFLEGRSGNILAGTTITGEPGLSPVSTDANGIFLLTAAPAGAYTLTAVQPGFLPATCAGVTPQEAGTRLNPVTLLAGDINGDAAVDIADAVALSAAFEQPGSAQIADFNLDGRVDILDLILMAANFGRNAADNPWLCQ